MLLASPLFASRSFVVVLLPVNGLGSMLAVGLTALFDADNDDVCRNFKRFLVVVGSYAYSLPTLLVLRETAAFVIIPRTLEGNMTKCMTMMGS